MRKNFERFIQNYRTDTGGINLYPQFDCDLEAILKFVSGFIVEAEDKYDCCWRPPIGEDD